MNYLMKHPKPVGTVLHLRANTPKVSKPYKIEVTGIGEIKWQLRTGQAFGCYADVKKSGNDFEIIHNHSNSRELFTLDHGKLYYGLVNRDYRLGSQYIYELESTFEATFSNEEKDAVISERVATKQGSKHYLRYDYKIHTIHVPNH